MPKPLNLFVRPPYGVWTVINGYGAQSGTSILRDLRLETSSTDFVKAACSGSLSIRHPNRSSFRNPKITPLASGNPIPDRISLYLNIRPVVGNPLFEQREKDMLGVLGFFYADLDGASLEAGLGALLDTAVARGGLSRQGVLKELLAGNVDVFVPGGHNIARAGPIPGSSNRQLAIAYMCVLGPFDPVMCMDHMRDFVDEGQPDVDALVAFAPWTAAISPSVGRADAIALTAQFTYPFPVLEQLRVDRALTPAEWRQVGDNQKALYLQRLLVRAGHGGASTEPPFEFNDPDGQNMFQLEAVAEFYANYPDPWAPGAVPRNRNAAAISGNTATPSAVSPGWLQLDGNPNLGFILPNHDLIFVPSSAHPSRTYRITEVDPAGHRVRIEGMAQAHVPGAGSGWRIEPYQVIDLLDPAGEQATVAGAVITLDGTADLTRIWPNGGGANDPVYDTIVLEAIQNPPRVFRIVSSDPTARTVTVDGTPTLPGASSPWRINLRPWLIMIDPMGNRLSGTSATVATGQPDRIQLDPTVVDLNKVNANFDTIYLPTDTNTNATPRRTYRILEANTAARWVRVNGNPVLPAAGPWHIQAGISGSGRLPGFAYSLGPGGTRGWDHFDAVLFLVHNNTIPFTMQWSSYTSRTYPDGNQNRSTIRGNKAYEYFSFRSANSFRNYSLKVVDVTAGMRPGWNQLFDGVREARWYFETNTAADVVAPPANPGTQGKTEIRLHHSVDTSGGGCSSAGCVVSPQYHQLRNQLAHIYDAEVQALGGAGDTQIQKLFNRTQPLAVSLYNGTGAAGLSANNYNNTLVGRIWIIRPDERPL